MLGSPYEQAKAFVFDEAGLGLVLVRSWFVDYRVGGHDLIGGEKNEGEEPEETVLREADEEGGIAVYGLRELMTDETGNDEFACITRFFTGLIGGSFLDFWLI